MRLDRFPVTALAWRNLSRAKARSALATLGILIGVVAIISLTMFGTTLQAFFLQGAQDFLQTVQVSPGEDSESPVLDQNEVAEIRQLVDASVYPVESQSLVVGTARDTTRATVTGTRRPRAFVTAATGRIPRNWRSGALVGQRLAMQLDIGVGDALRVGDRTVRVVAVLEENPRGGFIQANNGVFLPVSQLDTSGANRVLVREDSPEAAFAAAETIRQQLNTDRREQVRVFDAEASIQRFQSRISTIQTFLLGVGAVSLLVAAVSILNVMLMSAIERREEIGVLRAVGYHRRDVLRLMLGEAVLLGVVGAVGGAILSVGLGALINQLLLGDPMAFSEGVVGNIALGISFGIGAALLSGLYPAWKAANARPVEALRD
ncbi:MAG: putative ABC transport system permease protein [Halovenus sp.]|jgi:putative ABC transport system permease protein